MAHPQETRTHTNLGPTQRRTPAAPCGKHQTSHMRPDVHRHSQRLRTGHPVVPRDDGPPAATKRIVGLPTSSVAPEVFSETTLWPRLHLPVIVETMPASKQTRAQGTCPALRPQCKAQPRKQEKQDLMFYQRALFDQTSQKWAIVGKRGQQTAGPKHWNLRPKHSHHPTTRPQPGETPGACAAGLTSKATAPTLMFYQGRCCAHTFSSSWVIFGKNGQPTCSTQQSMISRAPVSPSTRQPLPPTMSPPIQPPSSSHTRHLYHSNRAINQSPNHQETNQKELNHL